MNLKRDYDIALKENREKDEYIENLEKNKKITKIRELEVTLKNLNSQIGRKECLHEWVC